MSEDTKEIEETPEAPVEETQEQIEEEVEETADDTPTLEDYQLEKQKRIEAEKKAQTLEAQKKHWQKKAEESLKTARAGKDDYPPTNQLTRDEAFLIAKGVNEEVLAEASFRANAKGISLKEAMEDPVVVTLQKSIESRERRSKAQLSPSTSGISVNGVDLMNAVGMTEEEHRKAIGM